MAPQKPLRQLAAEKIHGKGANPSQLGDPISLKGETTDTNDGLDNGPSSTKDMSTPPPPPPSSGGSHEEKRLHGPGKSSSSKL